MAKYQLTQTGAQVQAALNSLDTTNVTAGKVLTADGSGGSSWENAIPTITIALSQVVSQNPLQIALTDTQYNVFANNKQVIIDMSLLDPTLPVVVWNYSGESSTSIMYGFADTSNGNNYYQIYIDKTSKYATYYTGEKEVDISSLYYGSESAGQVLSVDSYGYVNSTRNLPILTTAPSQANTEGGIIIVVLSQEPQQKFSGYLYFIVNNS